MGVVVDDANQSKNTKGACIAPGSDAVCGKLATHRKSAYSNKVNAGLPIVDRGWRSTHSAAASGGAPRHHEAARPPPGWRGTRAARDG